MTTNTTPSLGNPEDSIFPIYNLLDLQGKGNLVEEMKRSLLTRNMDIVEGAIRAQVKPFLYNEGHGRKVSFAELVIMRNEKRTKAKLVGLPLHPECHFIILTSSSITTKTSAIRICQNYSIKSSNWRH